MTHMMGRESVRHFGLFLELLIKRVVTYTTFITEERKFQKSYMNSAWIKAMQTEI